MGLKKTVAQTLVKTGGLIKAIRNKVDLDGIVIDIQNIPRKTAATVFWGMYETSERRFINKYMREDIPIVELGTSIGVAACTAGKKSSQRIVCLEPNPSLQSVIKRNFELNNISNYTLINAAISYQSKQIFLHKTDMSAYDWIESEMRDGNVPVAAVTLSDILREHHIDEYVLISDIEGGELGILIDDAESLSKCQQMIIETHEDFYKGEKYNTDEIRNLIVRAGFRLVDSHGPNFVCEKIVKIA